MVVVEELVVVVGATVVVGASVEVVGAADGCVVSAVADEQAAVSAMLRTASESIDRRNTGRECNPIEGM